MPHVVARRMSEGMDERPTLALSLRIASRQQQRLFDSQGTLVISLNLPHQYVGFCDGLCGAVELPSSGPTSRRISSAVHGSRSREQPGPSNTAHSIDPRSDLTMV